MKKLKQAVLSLWFEGSDPTKDPPDEIGGVMQDTLEATQKFASEMLWVHWCGECQCQTSFPQHEESINCWCKPRIESYEGGNVVIHNEGCA